MYQIKMAQMCIDLIYSPAFIASILYMYPPAGQIMNEGGCSTP